MRGLIGQVRGFNLDEFLSDYEEPGAAIPWALGNDAWVASESDPLPSVPGPGSGPVAGATLAASFAAARVKSRLKVLYATDYIPASSRLERTAALVRELSLCMPNYEIQLGLAEGPFEDDMGVASHFGKEAFLAKQASKQILATRVDLHTSVVKLARHAAMHNPKLVIGDGQGALAAIGYGKASVLETAMATRNVQRREAQQIAEAWGNVSCVLVQSPRMSKSQFGLVSSARAV